jgi:hypothetical protein
VPCTDVHIRNIGTVAAARELTRLVYYGLRDGHVALSPHDRHTLRSAAGRAGHDPQALVWSPPLIDLDRPLPVTPLHAAPPRRRDD